MKTNMLILFFLDAMNETNKMLHINEDVLAIAEVGFLKIRDIILCKKKFKNKFSAK